MAITRAQQFRQMLEDGGMTKKIKGQKHMLAYITPGEAKTLENLGGQKTMTPEGIPAYPPPGKGAQGPGGSGGGTGGDQTSGGGGGSQKDDDPSPQGGGRNPMAQFSGTKKTKKTPPADRDKFKADRKTFVRNIKKAGKKDKGIGGFLDNFAAVKFARALKDSEFNKRRRAGFMTDLDALSKRFQKRRNINLPFGIGTFDANARTKNNLLQALLEEAQDDLGLVAMSPGPFDYMNKRSIALSDLPKDRQDEIYDKVMDARMSGKTDAAGNLKSGFMFDAQGNIISTGNDGRDDSVIIPTTTAAVDVGDTASEEDPFAGGIGYRFFADGGMPKDAPVGGIMDIESGRQMYFLGKLVKKAKRAVSKIVKSPIGKAALLGGALYFGGAGKGLGSFFGKGSFNPLKAMVSSEGFSGLGPSKFAQFLGKFGLADASKMALTGKGMLALGGLGLTALPFLTGQEEEEDQMILDRGPGLNIAQIRRDAILNPGAVYGNAFRLYGNSGGRAAFDQGGEAGGVISEKEMKKLAKSPLYKGFKKMYKIDPSMAKENSAYDEKFSTFEKLFKKGFQKGGDVEPVAKETMPLLKMGGKEMDLRDNGGFVPIGRMERADDVPARLSKNEFVFTADAVRNAGGGDIDKGAEVMYNTMKNLEAGGEVSEETQGLDGARNMFQTAKRLEEVL